MFTLAALFVATLQSFAFGATSEFPVSGNEKILISVPDALINIQTGTGRSLRVTLAEGANDEYVAKMEGNVLEIKAREPAQKENFGRIAPRKRVIEIQGPSVPLEIHAFEGQIILNKWSKEALLHLQKGRIISRDGQSTLMIHSLNGEIQALDHQGKLDIDTYKAQVTVKNLNGDAELENFAGETVIDKAKGFLSLRQIQGSAKVLNGSGTLQFEVNKGILTVPGFLGRIEGQTQEGPVNVTLSSDTDVNIRSQNAKVTVNGGSSGASLNLVSQEGDIYVPNYLKVGRDGSVKTLRGRLKGDAQKGSVVIRSQEGSITVR